MIGVATSRLIAFLGRAGDRNALGSEGARLLAEGAAQQIGVGPVYVGTPQPPLDAAWTVELAAAQSDLRLLAGTLADAFEAGCRPLTTMGRCAAGLATLPVVARTFSDAAIIWFDAHGDCNVPDHSTTGYLGGMVLSGACGLWESGLGTGVALQNIILAGSRDLDPFERRLIADGRLCHVAVGPNFAPRLLEAIGDRSVYVHLDCDVLEPGLVPTEYVVPGGLTLADLHEACVALARARVVGVEIAEFQCRWPTGEPAVGEPLLEAIAPLF